MYYTFISEPFRPFGAEITTYWYRMINEIKYIQREKFSFIGMNTFTLKMIS